jgi:hypothetical protein
MQALPVHQRQSYADRWSVLEAALGRPSFHALFDHYITIEQATEAASQDSGSNQQKFSWAHTPNDASPNGSSSSSVVPFIPAGSSLMHLQAVSSDSISNGHHNQPQQHSETAAAGAGVVVAAGQQQRHDVLQQLTGHADVEGMLNMVLEYGQQLLQIRANDWSALEAEGGTGEYSGAARPLKAAVEGWGQASDSSCRYVPAIEVHWRPSSHMRLYRAVL